MMCHMLVGQMLPELMIVAMPIDDAVDDVDVDVDVCTAMNLLTITWPMF
jgi:hypothetical protein